MISKLALVCLMFGVLLPVSEAKNAETKAPKDTKLTATLTGFLATQGFVKTKYIRLDSGHALVEGQINGVYGHFIIDSGAGGTVVHRTQAARFSLMPKRHAGTATGVGGNMDVLGTTVESMQIGESKVALDAIYIMDLSHVLDALSPFTEHKIDGVIGQDFLQSHHAIIDIAEDTLYFKIN